MVLRYRVTLTQEERKRWTIRLLAEKLAEFEINVLKRQCFAERIDCVNKMRQKVADWNLD